MPVFIVVVATAAVGAYGLPPVYTASSTIVVEPTKAPAIRAEPYVGRVETVEAINTEMVIVLSRTVLQNAVDRLKLAQRPDRAGAVSRAVAQAGRLLVGLGLLSSMDRREQWIVGLMSGVKVRPTVNSNIFTVHYSSDDPRLAAEIVNAVTDEYLTHHFDVYSEKGIAEFYRTQMEQAKAKLDAGRAEIERFKTEKSLAAPSVRKEGLVGEMKTVRERTSALGLELKDAMARLGAGDPRVALLREKMRAGEDEAARLSQQLQELDRAEARAAELEVMVKAQERTYLTQREQYEHSALSAAGNKNVVNVRVVDYASVPVKPTFSRLFAIAAGAAAGVVLALGLAMVREYFDRRVVTPAVAEEVLGVPVLGSIARGDLWGDQRAAGGPERGGAR